MSDFEFSNDIVDNGQPLLPLCLCLDTSGSMRGQPIAELNRGIELFYDNVRKDEVACAAADVCIVTFGEGGARCQYDFASLFNRPTPPTLKAGGNTPMGDAVNLALDLLEKRRNEYRAKGVEHYKPWLVLMTDGHPYGDSSKNAVSTAQKRASDMVSKRDLVVFPIWVGHDNTANGMDTLAGFSPQNRPRQLKGVDFASFFGWLSKSVSATSHSSSESDIKLPPLEWSVV